MCIMVGFDVAPTADELEMSWGGAFDRGGADIIGSADCWTTVYAELLTYIICWPLFILSAVATVDAELVVLVDERPPLCRG